MPDEWETAHGLDPAKNDSTSVQPSGYTAVEDYLHCAAASLLGEPNCGGGSGGSGGEGGSGGAGGNGGNGGAGGNGSRGPGAGNGSTGQGAGFTLGSGGSNGGDGGCSCSTAGAETVPGGATLALLALAGLRLRRRPGQRRAPL